MIRVVFADLLAHKRRLVGTALAVLVGVAFLAATLVLTGSLRSGFDDLFARANDGIEAVVRHDDSVGSDLSAATALVDSETVRTVAELPGLRSAEQIEGLAQITGADGEPLGGEGPPTLGAAWIDDADLTPWRIDDGRAPRSASEIVIDRRSADMGELAVGDVTTVRTPEPVTAEIVGIATFLGDDSQGTITYTAFAPDQAREVLIGGEPGATAVLVASDDGRGEHEVTAEVAAAVGGDLSVISGTELTEEQIEEVGSDFLNFFEAFLLVFSGVALAVAAFSIHNTFAVISAQRTRTSALLRALGASRRQVLVAALAEALVIGVVASVVAIGLGILMGAGLIALLSGLNTGLPSVELVVGATPVVVALIAGVAMTVVAALGSAVRASRVPPLAALREVAAENTRPSVTRGVIGTALVATGAALMIVGASGGGSLAAAGLGALGVTVGAVVMGPVIAGPVSSLLGRPLTALRGLSGQLARRNAMRNPRRTAGTATALMIGVGVVTLFTVFADSVKTSVDESVQRSFGGDLVVSVASFSGAGLSPELAPELSRLEEVDTVAGLGIGAARFDGEEREVSVVDPEPFGGLLELDPVAGDPAELGADELAVSEAAAEDRGWELGEEVTVDFIDGTDEVVTVGAIYASRDLMGDFIVPRSLWEAHSRTSVDVAVLIGLAEGVGADQARPAVDAVSQRYQAPAAEDRDEYIQSVAGEVDQFLVVVYALLVLSILIALMGIANTLALAVHERTRELGLLRAVGQTRRQVRATIRAEAVLIALFGTLGGLALGGFLGWGVMGVMSATEGIGTFSVPLGQVGLIAAVGTAVGVLAALRPARNAGRLDVLEAIATE